MKYKILKFFLPPILAFALAISLNIFAFTEPTLAPPGGNVSAPLNVSPTAQTKAGKLELSSSSVDNVLTLTRIPLAPGLPQLTNFRVGTDGAMVINNSGLDALTLKDGNVGIGTTGPNRKLDIGNGSDGITIGQQLDNTQSIQAYIDGQWANRTTYAGGCCNSLLLQPDVGNVGIGTTGPVNKLDVNGDVALLGKHAFRGNDSWLRLNQDGAFVSGVHTPGVFAPVSLNVGGAGGWGNPGAGNVWITGNVGIGTTGPSQRLDVLGNIKVGQADHTSILLRDDESPNGIKYIHANSNVVGFLSGAGTWLSYWDDAGNQNNTGGANFPGAVSIGALTFGFVNEQVVNLGARGCGVTDIGIKGIPTRVLWAPGGAGGEYTSIEVKPSLGVWGDGVGVENWKWATNTMKLFIGGGKCFADGVNVYYIPVSSP